MRILVSNTMRGWSGETAYVGKVCIGLAARGHEVVLATRRGSQVGDRCREAGVRVVDLDLGRAPWALLRDLGALRRLLRGTRPDVLLCNASRDSWLVTAAARLFAKATRRVRTKHNLKRIRGGPLNRLLYRRLVQALIAPATTVEAQLRTCPVTADRPIRQIWYGVDLADYRAADDVRAARRAELLAQLPPAPGDPFVVVYCSRLTERKHPELAIEAVRRLAAAGGRPLRLVVVGDASTPHGQRCVQLAGDAPEVRFLGFQRDVRPFLAGADAFVLPSPDEAFGMAVIEAMAAGAVPILPDRAPFPTMIADGGELFSWEGGVAALAAAIARLRDDPARLAGCRTRGREQAETFGVERMVAATEQFLCEVAAPTSR